MTRFLLSPDSWLPLGIARNLRFLILFAMIGEINALPAVAQQTTLACNDDTNWINGGGFTNITASATASANTSPTAGTLVTGTNNLTDGDLSNSAAITLAAQSTNLCLTTHDAQASLTVSHGSNAYNLGNYVGFLTSTDLSAFTSVTIAAVNSSNTVVSSTTAPIISATGDGKFQVGFVTTGTGTFSQLRISLTLSSAGNCNVVQSVGVFNAFQVKYCPTATFDCNTPGRLDLFNSNLTATSSGIELLGGVFDEVRAVTPLSTDYARVNQVVASLTEKWFQVRDNVKVYPTGTFAGFEISRGAVLDLNLLGSLTIQARMNGTIVDSETGAGLLLSGELLSASSRNTIGFTADAPFNEIRIVFAGVSISVGETRIYNAVFEQFCEGGALACNIPTTVTAPAYPLSLSTIRTGVTGAVCLACNIADAGNAIDANQTNSAVINVTGTVGAIGSLSVRKELASYPAGTFAGFDIGNTSLAGLGLFTSISIRTYENGVLKEEKLNGAGLANIGLIQGSRQTIGFLTTQSFDEVQISVQQLVGVALGSTQVYGVVVQSFCNDGALACNVPNTVTVPNNTVFVNGDHTGVNAVICGACTLTNTQAVVDGTSTNDFATLALGLSVGSNGQFAVKNAITDYPGGYYAGFEIQTSTLLNVNALSGLRIRFYLNGVETPGSASPGYSGTNLIVGASLLQGSSRQIVGAVSENPFDEVQIQFINLASANLGTIQIYNAIVEPLCNNNPIVCNTIRTLVAPDQPVVLESSRTGLQGGVCALCAVSNASNVVSSDPTDFARIAIGAGVLNTGSISVKNGVVDYLGGSAVGFAIRDLQNLIQADLFGAITLSTYLNGSFQQQASGTSLINLQLNIPIINAGGGVYYVSFTPTLPFDEVRLTLRSVASVLNEIQVYSAFVRPFVPGCETPLLVFTPIPPRGYVSSTYNAQSPLAVATYTGTGARYSTVAGTDFNRLPPGLTMDPTTGIISGIPTGPTGMYTFMVEVRDQDNNIIGQRLYSIAIEGALPVKLISFTAVQEGKSALTSWSTSEELHSAYFDLERSGDGKSWKKIASKAASGNSKILKNYFLLDASPQGGDNYYRLKMVDLDGTSAYSHIERLYFSEEDQAALYPNPVTRSENLRVNIRDWNAVSMVRMLNMAGKEVYAAERAPGEGIRTQHLPAGVYLVQIVHKGGEVSTYKFVKQ